jgi:valyl-tRNA synthetase
MAMKELAKAYDPKSVEEKWYGFWMQKKYFHADESAHQTPFSIVIPPPIVTG